MTALPDLPNVLWLDTYGEYKPEPHLRGDVKVDIAIIGGGFTGLCHFVNRIVIPWPPEPLRIVLAKGIRGYLRVEDWAYERHLPRH